MAKIELQGVTKRFGGAVAVDAVHLTIPDKAFVSLLGPSGCGKSTTLNLLAGLEELSEGRILLDGQPIEHLPPNERNMAMVFQNYALYPHMSVFDNIAFGLRIARRPEAEVRERVTAVAEMVGVAAFLKKRPRQLSGGQQQRVALARALVRKPKIFLLDEPLSNLDAKLRIRMRYEIRKLQQAEAVTTVYVTHDQSEAMTMSDWIAVMSDGCVQQFDRPHEIYHRPANLFVAGFVGSPAMNFFHGEVTGAGDEARFGLAGGARLSVLLPSHLVRALAQAGVQKAVLGIRPEHLMVEPADRQGDFGASVELVESLGTEDFLDLGLGESMVLTARVAVDHGFRNGDSVSVRINWAKAHFFDEATGKRIEVGA